MRTTDKMENCILILYYYIIFTYLIVFRIMSTLLPHSIHITRLNVHSNNFFATQFWRTFW